jgi:hypothetical protein
VTEPSASAEPTGEAGWAPANDAERAMLAAAATDDRVEYFRVVAIADLFLPQLSGDRGGEQRFLTMQGFGHTLLPVFTSVQALVAQCAGRVDAYTVTSYAELRRKWPDPAWRLAVNPGTPLDAYVPIEAVESAALGDVAVPTMAELVVEAADDEERHERLSALRAERVARGEPDDTGEALRAAARAGDVHGYVERLLDAVVLLPTAVPVDAEAIVEPGFPWRPTGPPDQPVIEVFTSVEAMTRSAAPPTSYVEVALPFALAVWPEGHGLTVDGDEGIALPADQVQWLLAWDVADE